MKTILLAIFSLAISFNEVFSCSVLFYADQNVCFAGNNEDHFLPFTQIQFIPSEKGKHGRVFWGYYPETLMHHISLWIAHIMKVLS